MNSVFQALAEPTRRRILDLLRERPRPVGELVEALGITQPGVSKHLRVLREAKLVRVRQDAQRRWYELQPGPLAEVDAWLAAYRAALEERYSRLDSLLSDLQQNDLQVKESTDGTEKSNRDQFTVGS
jgi:DNA-binding transcriptional ArsR family regulator